MLFPCYGVRWSDRYPHNIDWQVRSELLKTVNNRGQTTVSLAASNVAARKVYIELQRAHNSIALICMLWYIDVM
jgi:hypothetical protein